MATPLERIVDHKGVEIKVGSRVNDSDHTGTVYKISESDVDYDDDAGRAIMFNPKVYVSFGMNGQDEYNTDWVEERYSPAEAQENDLPMKFEAFDLEVVEDAVQD